MGKRDQMKAVGMNKINLLLGIATILISGAAFAQTPPSPADAALPLPPGNFADFELPGMASHVILPNIQPNPSQELTCQPYPQTFDSEHMLAPEHIEAEARRLTRERLDASINSFPAVGPAPLVNTADQGVASFIIGGYVYQRTVYDRIRAYVTLGYYCSYRGFSRLLPQVSRPAMDASGPSRISEAQLIRNTTHDSLRNLIWLTNATATNLAAGERAVSEVRAALNAGYAEGSPLRAAGMDTLREMNEDFTRYYRLFQRDHDFERGLVDRMTQEQARLDAILAGAQQRDCSSANSQGASAGDAGVGDASVGDASVANPDASCGPVTLTPGEAQEFRQHASVILDGYANIMEQLRGTGENTDENHVTHDPLAPPPAPEPAPAVTAPIVQPAPVLLPPRPVLAPPAGRSGTVAPRAPARRNAPARRAPARPSLGL